DRRPATALQGRGGEPPRPDRPAPGAEAPRHAFALPGLGGGPPRRERLAGVGVEPVEDEPLALLGVLHAGLAEIVEDGGHEVRRRSRRAGSLRLAVFPGWQDAVRRQAFDGERPGHADNLPVLIGLGIEDFGVGMPANGGVDLLAGHALLDVWVVGDALERDVWHALVDETLADVALGRSVSRKDAGKFGLFLTAFRGVGQEVVREAGGHEPG